MAGPELFVKNTLRLSESGIGDGTLYATGTSATVNQVTKTFALVGKTLIADIGTDSDDKFNGYLLTFPGSGNRYHIVDWVSATNTVTVWESPDTSDVGNWEFRRSLLDNNALASSPALFLSDGLRHRKWKPSAATFIEIHLHNFIVNGGFEHSAMSPWTITPIGGTADTTGLNTTSPLLGNQDLKIDLGDRSQVVVQQTGIGTFKKNRTYRLIFKAKAVGSFVQDDFDVRFAGNTGNEVVMAVPSTGNVSGPLFRPTLTTAATWHSADILIPDYDIINPSLLINMLGSTFDVFIDEIYVFEKVNVSAIIIFDHNGWLTMDKIVGRNVTSDRSGQSVGIDNFDIYTSSLKLLGGNSGIIEFTSSVYPIFGISLSDVQGASEIMLCEKWPWLHGPDRGRLDFEETKYTEKTFTTRNGTRSTVRHSESRVFKNTYPSMPDTERIKLLSDWKPFHRDDLYPFGIRLRPGDAPMMMIDRTSTFNNPYIKINANWPFDFEEVV